MLALHHNPGYYVGFDATQASLTGMITVALTGGVFGALLITVNTRAAPSAPRCPPLPSRPLLLATKMGVTAVLAAVVCEVLSFVSFFLGQAILSGGGAPSATLASPGAARAVVLTGLFIALIALMSFGFGLIFRSTAAAIAAFAGVIFVLPLVHARDLRDRRPLPADQDPTDSVMSTVNQGQGGPFGPVSPVVGLLLMVVYAAIALAVGAVVFVRRDA